MRHAFKNLKCVTSKSDSLPLSPFLQLGGQQVEAMLSLDEPLDLKLPRRANGKDRGARSPLLSPLHAKQVRQLHMTDDGTAIIEPTSPASPHSGRCSLSFSLL